MEPSLEHRLCIVYVTAPKALAERLGRLLVEQRLAACVNLIGPVHSLYRWNEQLCNDEECLMMIKTRLAQFERLRATVVAEHTYEVPEVIAVPIVAGHPDYLAWIDAMMETIDSSEFNAPGSAKSSAKPHNV